MSIDEQLIARQVKSIVEGTSIAQATRELGIGREQILRIVAGLPVSRGTMLVAHEALAARSGSGQ